MPTIIAPETRVKAASEVRNLAVDFSKWLDSGELLTGTPLAVDVAGVLATSAVAVSTTTLTINGASVAAGKAVTFAVGATGVAGTTYTIKITAGTDATPPQTRVCNVRLLVVADS